MCLLTSDRWNLQVEETMLTPHAVAELADPSSGLEQQLFNNQLEDLHREFSLLRHVPLQSAAEPEAARTTGLDVLSAMVGECLGAYTRQVSIIHSCQLGNLLDGRRLPLWTMMRMDIWGCL